MGLYGLPFDGIKGIRAEIGRLKDQQAQLDIDESLLKQELFSVLGYGMPIALTRSGSKAFVPLVWRDMTQGRDRRIDIPFDGELVQRVLTELPPEKRLDVLNIELKRVHLNFALGTLRFQLMRLKRLEGEFDAWRKIMRVKQQ
ncbi:MAG: hypothetical protein PHE17_15030 [Thiothrix sp.]|uniref:hypothetical protein n=1 Tax=Thiothrix sp. TaxID=1032 RepID=UPI002626CFA3|nr:hypothetical protein [Thiothrix sp.]MDD5394326.1 hypothetical protein [Thiothrix sp.]